MPTTSTKEMDALSLLKHDHDDVKEKFAQFEKSRARQGQLADEICMELTAHAHIEEQIFYPEVKKLPGLEDSVLESLEEHRQMKEMIARISAMSPEDKRFGPDMKVLQEDTEHHIKDEETEMFPMVKKGLDKERLLKLGQRMQQRKTLLTSQLTEKRITEDVREGAPTPR